MVTAVPLPVEPFVDHTRAFSQDLSAVDLQGHETDGIVQGLGTLYTWNLLSPRVGLTGKAYR